MRHDFFHVSLNYLRRSQKIIKRAYARTYLWYTHLGTIFIEKYKCFFPKGHIKF